MADAEAALAVALHRIAPPSVRVGVRALSDDDEDGLFAEELAGIRHAVRSRRREFASGRVLLRQVIERHVPIPIGGNRAPVLPAGVRASLAHDDAYVVAAGTRDEDIAALGIDVEPSGELAPELSAIVLRHDELHLDACLAFTLKEAAYKAWSVNGGRTLDHHDVRLTVAGESFRAEVLPDGLAMRGCFVTAAGRVVALVVHRRRAGAR